MANLETPDIRHSTYSASAMNLNQAAGNAVAYVGQLNQQGSSLVQAANQFDKVVAAETRLNQYAQELFKTPPRPKELPMTTRRLVQVFIVDPQEAVPVHLCVLYRGDLHVTDLTDQELFYEVDIKKLLHQHNENRATIIDKSVKDRTQYLEPARIRDLRMQIVTVAQF